MIRRAGLSCCGKDASALILYALEDLSSSCRPNMAGYAAKEFSWRCLLQVYANVVADFCVRRGGKRLLGCPLSVLDWGCWLVEVWWVVPLEVGRCLY